MWAQSKYDYFQHITDWKPGFSLYLMLDGAMLFAVFALGEKSGFWESRAELVIFRGGETRFLEIVSRNRVSLKASMTIFNTSPIGNLVSLFT
jgi:hypothetical protein